MSFLYENEFLLIAPAEVSSRERKTGGKADRSDKISLQKIIRKYISGDPR